VNSINKWYIVNVIAGQENKVCAELNDLIKRQCDDIYETIVPMKKVSKCVRGKRVDGLQKLFPNYVFVRMNMNKNSHAAVKNIRGVLSFLGSKTRPEEVSDSKMEKLLNKINDDNDSPAGDIYEVGDVVKVIEGPFETFSGVIESKDVKKNILKISISIFGRPTIVEIEVNKVEKI